MNQQLILTVPSKGDLTFIFGVAGGTEYESLATSSQGGWVNLDIVDGKAASQNTHLPLVTKKINGKWFGGEGKSSVSRLRQIQQLRAPVLLTDGYGYSYGLWKIMSVDDNERDVIDDGTPMIITFSVALEEYAN